MTAPSQDDARTKRLLEGNVLPTLLFFSLPLLASNFLHTIAGTWSAFLVSHELGEGAFIAVSNATILIWLMIGSVMGFGMAAGIAIGQAFGAKQQDAIKRITGTAISYAFLLGTFIGIMGFFYAGTLIDVVNIPPLARKDAILYIKALSLGMPFLFIFIFLMMILRNLGDARTPFLFTCLWVGLGMSSTYVFLTGAWGFPPLGIIGAGLASPFSNGIALCTMLVYIYHKKLPLALARTELHHLKPHLPLLWMITKNGSPMALENIIVQGSYFVLLGMVNLYGAHISAAYGAAAQIWGYVQMPAVALAASMSAMAAQNIGANQWRRVNEIALKGCMIGFFITGGSAMLIYACGDWPLRLFLAADSPALPRAREINYIVLWSWMILTVTMGLFAIIRANGSMLVPMIIFAITMWVLRIPFAKFLEPVLGVSAIWWSFPVGIFGAAFMAFLYYHWGAWRTRDLLINS